MLISMVVVAQSVERRIVVPQVTGSNPVDHPQNVFLKFKTSRMKCNGCTLVSGTSRVVRFQHFRFIVILGVWCNGSMLALEARGGVQIAHFQSCRIIQLARMFGSYPKCYGFKPHSCNYKTEGTLIWRFLSDNTTP